MNEVSSDQAIWEDDLLSRRAEADHLEKFLIGRITERESQGRSKSYVLNLNADWGQGKSFFLQRFGQQLQNHGYLVARVDAWADDHADDPLLPVMIAINRTAGTDSKREKSVANLKKIGFELAAATAKGVVTRLAHRVVSEDALKEIGDLSGNVLSGAREGASSAVSKIYDDTGKALIDRFEKNQKSITHFRDQLAKVLAEGDKKPLFVLIDEVDRCRPTYAISLLERIKHIFEVDNVVFVVATNTKQLRHSISAIYGAVFDSARYLDRFFDRTYELHVEKDLLKYVKYLIQQLQIDRSKLSFPPHYTDEIKYIVDGFNYFGFGLRDIAQCMDVLRSILTVWEYPAPVEIDLLFPLLIAQHRDIPFSISSETSSALEKLAHPPETLDWTVPFPPYKGPTAGAVAGLPLFRAHCAEASRSYEKLFEDNHEQPTPSVQWIRTRLQNEFQVRTERGEKIELKSKSIQSGYANMVRSAGRLKVGSGS